MQAYVTIWFCHYHLINALTRTSFFLNNKLCILNFLSADPERYGLVKEKR